MTPLKPWQELAQENAARLQKLAMEGVQIGGLSETWAERLWGALLGPERLDELHMEQEQWTRENLDAQDEAIRNAVARQKLITPAANGGGKWN